MFVPSTPVRRELGDALVLRSLSDRSDLDRVAAFNELVHGPGHAALTRELVLHHPATRPEHWLFVEDTATQQVVSSLCLIPWTWRYEDVELKCGEMGIVGTLESYRHRGLVRAQAQRHAELLREGGFDLGHIQGIPYFYRQFGYEYALPLEGGWRVDLHTVPGERAPDGKVPYVFRPATVDDLPALSLLYDRSSRELRVAAVRAEQVWRYLLGPSLQTETAAETWLAVDGHGVPIGYLRVPQRGFDEGLIVNEVSHLSAVAALSALIHLKALALARGKPWVRLNLPVNSTLVQVARYHGAHSLGTYAWQIKVVDVARLLGRLAPVLDRRLAASSLADLNAQVVLNLYREAFRLSFEGGRLVSIQQLGFSREGGIRLPPQLLAPLVLGYRSREELAQTYHDVFVQPEWQYLVDVVFPKLPSFIYTTY